MRKIIFTALLGCLCLGVKAQKVNLPLKDSAIVYEEVTSLDSAYKKELLYKTAKTWFVNTFKSSKAVIQSDDSQSGRIIGKGELIIPTAMNTYMFLPNRIDFTIQIDVKDSKYRCKIYDFVASGEQVIGSATFDVDASKAYSQYLHNNFKAHGFTKLKTVSDNLDKSFASLSDQMMGVFAYLKMSMQKSTSDEF